VTLAYTDSAECVFIREKTFDWFPLVPLNPLRSDPQAGCVPVDAILAVQQPVLPGNYTVTWSSQTTLLGQGISIRTTFENPGVYDINLKIESPAGCRFDSTFTGHVKAYPNPKAAFGLIPVTKPLTALDARVQCLDNSTDADQWLWQFSDGFSSTSPNLSYTFRDTGVQEIVLYVSNAGGCKDSVSARIDVAPLFFFEFPNAFTPNYDGLNDDFKPKSLFSGFQRYHMKVFNRWGGVVHESFHPDSGWNGTYHSEESPSGIYTYVVQAQGPRGEVLEKTGQVLLIR
jgi:gliding motility-associated-like protein